jgi:diadenosine tetraphosphatase ApaH/serine/threonine PP2A family protein phosphatase
MRVAVISDIHGNLHALEAVIAAIDEAAVDGVWCLGDVVGYGPRPNECVQVIRGRADVALVGNHDLGVLGRLDLDEFSPDAAEAARWTRSTLGDDERTFLEGLEPAARRDGAELFHASPRDPVWEYVLSEAAARAAFAATTAPVVLVGHSHVPLALLAEHAGEVQGGLAPADASVALGAGRWLLNPGSVGQPRDGDPRAAWLLLDTTAGGASFRRVPYEVARTQAEIDEAGLPPALAVRLSSGA